MYILREVAVIYGTPPFDQQAEQEKQRQFMERTRDIQKHRMEMMVEKERQQREEQRANEDTLKQKRAHDLKVSFLYSPFILPLPAVPHPCSSTRLSRRRQSEHTRKPLSCSSFS